MPNLIDHTFFIGSINIANTNQQSVQGQLTALINKYEKELLTDLLGHLTYKDLSANAIPIERWDRLKAGVAEYEDAYGYKTSWMGLAPASKQSLIANYVYYWYQRTQATQTTGVGESITKAENAVRESPMVKMASAYNEMVKWIFELCRFMEAHPTDYPDFDKHCIKWQYFQTVNPYL
ncbi:MAG TPA: hypothetical protein VF487_20315 [Chitinophagaceae bacterium]